MPSGPRNCSIPVAAVRWVGAAAGAAFAVCEGAAWVAGVDGDLECGNARAVVWVGAVGCGAALAVWLGGGGGVCGGRVTGALVFGRSKLIAAPVRDEGAAAGGGCELFNATALVGRFWFNGVTE